MSQEQFDWQSKPVPLMTFEERDEQLGRWLDQCNDPLKCFQCGAEVYEDEMVTLCDSCYDDICS